MKFQDSEPAPQAAWRLPRRVVSIVALLLGVATLLALGVGTAAAAGVDADVKDSGSRADTIPFAIFGASWSLQTEPVWDANPQTLMAASSTSITITNYSVPANNDRLLVAYAANVANSPSPVVTFNGTPMTAGPTRSEGGLRATLYYLVLGSGASAAVGDIVATGTTMRYLAATSFHNVDQGDPTDGESTAAVSGTPTSVSVTINSDACGLALDFLAYFAPSGATDINEGASQTLLFKDAGGSPVIRYGASTQPGVAPSVAMDWTIAGTPSGASGSLVGMNLRGAAGCTASIADLSISKIVAADLVVPGAAITYTLSFINNGPAAATGVVLSDSVPLSVTVTGVTSSTFGSGVYITQTSGAPDFTWVTSDLAVGAGGSITLMGTVAGDAWAGLVITNTAMITSSSDITPANNSSSAAVTVAAPSAVTVGDFAAIVQADGVQLTWQTLNEVGLYGFHLYRGPDPAGPGERITGDPVPALGAGGLQGFAYRYDDVGTPPAATVYYWLEELHGDGSVERHGPQAVGGVGGPRIFLPLIKH